MLAFYLTLLDDEDDRDLFQALFTRYEGAVLRAALRILGSQALAEETAQETWLKTLNNFSAVKSIPGDGAGRWLIAVVKNTALDVLRRERRITPMEAPPEDGGTWDTDRRADYRALVAIIRAMPESERRVLELRFLQEYSYRELAEALGVSESAAASRVFRARNKLIERLR